MTENEYLLFNHGARHAVLQSHPLGRNVSAYLDDRYGISGNKEFVQNRIGRELATRNTAITDHPDHIRMLSEGLEDRIKTLVQVSDECGGPRSPVRRLMSNALQEAC